MNLPDKKVIVTGGVRGIGRCTVEALLDERAVVGVLDIDKNGLDGLKKACPAVHCVECDLTDPDQVEGAIDGFCDRFGTVDVLVNNAGILINAPLVKVGPDGLEKHGIGLWQKVISTNLSSVFYTTVCVAEKMVRRRTKGVIVNISSVCAGGNAGQTAYSAAKAGVDALTATWAKELGLLGIRVVGVAPGYCNTESTRQVMSEQMIKEAVGEVPLRRLGKPEEVAEGIVAVIKNDFFHGKVLHLDGGLVV